MHNNDNDPISFLRSDFRIARAFAAPSPHTLRVGSRGTNEVETKEFWGIMRLVHDTQRTNYAGPGDCEVLAGPESFTPPVVKVVSLKDHHGAEEDYLESRCYDCGAPSSSRFCHFCD